MQRQLVHLFCSFCLTQRIESLPPPCDIQTTEARTMVNAELSNGRWKGGGSCPLIKLVGMDLWIFLPLNRPDLGF